MTRTGQIAVAAKFIALLILVQTPGEAKAQRKGEGAIRRVMQRFEARWNKHDVDSFVELFAPDAEFTNPWGVKRSGRNEIKNYHAGPFGAKVRILVTNVRIKFYAKNIATVDCEHTLTRFDNGKPLPTIETAPLFIMKKVEGQWLIAVLHVALREAPGKTSNASLNGSTGTPDD